MTLQAIADVLNAEGVPTLRGGAMWRPSSVQRAAGYRRPSALAGGHRAAARRGRAKRNRELRTLYAGVGSGIAGAS